MNQETKKQRRRSLRRKRVEQIDVDVVVADLAAPVEPLDEGRGLDSRGGPGVGDIEFQTQT